MASRYPPRQEYYRSSVPFDQTMARTFPAPTTDQAPVLLVNAGLGQISHLLSNFDRTTSDERPFCVACNNNKPHSSEECYFVKWHKRKGHVARDYANPRQAVRGRIAPRGMNQTQMTRDTQYEDVRTPLALEHATQYFR